MRARASYNNVCTESLWDCQELQGKARQNELESLRKELSTAKNARLATFTPRDLMEELARRGYKGKLTYTKIEEINIENF